MSHEVNVELEERLYEKFEEWFAPQRPWYIQRVSADLLPKLKDNAFDRILRAFYDNDGTSFDIDFLFYGDIKQSQGGLT